MLLLADFYNHELRYCTGIRRWNHLFLCLENYVSLGSQLKWRPIFPIVCHMGILMLQWEKMVAKPRDLSPLEWLTLSSRINKRTGVFCVKLSIWSGVKCPSVLLHVNKLCCWCQVEVSHLEAVVLHGFCLPFRKSNPAPSIAGTEEVAACSLTILAALSKWSCWLTSQMSYGLLELWLDLLNCCSRSLSFIFNWVA